MYNEANNNVAGAVKVIADTSYSTRYAIILALMMIFS